MKAANFGVGAMAASTNPYQRTSACELRARNSSLCLIWLVCWTDQNATSGLVERPHSFRGSSYPVFTDRVGLATLAQDASFRATANVWDFDAEGGG